MTQVSLHGTEPPAYAPDRTQERISSRGMPQTEADRRPAEFFGGRESGRNGCVGRRARFFSRERIRIRRIRREDEHRNPIEATKSGDWRGSGGIRWAPSGWPHFTRRHGESFKINLLKK